VYEATRGDSGPLDRLHGRLDKLPPEALAGRSVPEDEMVWELRSFALYFGAAYAVVRMEAPLVGEAVAVERAWEAAIEAHRLGHVIVRAVVIRDAIVAALQGQPLATGDVEAVGRFAEQVSDGLRPKEAAQAVEQARVIRVIVSDFPSDRIETDADLDELARRVYVALGDERG